MDIEHVIDFHTHTLLSDGALCPAELGRRAEVAGYLFLGFADHADHGTMETIITQARTSAFSLNGHFGEMVILPGVELTHVPPSLIADGVKRARDLGASHVVVHGETITEPVAPGTNMAAIMGGADILAHPGFITEEEMALAAERDVFVELSARKGHCLLNGRIVNLARRFGTKLVINSDGHAPGDYLTPFWQHMVGLGAGLSQEEYEDLFSGALELAKKFQSRLISSC